MNSLNGPNYYHQLGHNDQKRCLELLTDGFGIGAILSPRDLARGESSLQKYAEQYKSTNTELLVDPQFYVSEAIPENVRSDSLLNTTSDFANPAVAKAVLSSSLEQQKSLSATRFLIPSPFYDSPTSEFANILYSLTDMAQDWGSNFSEPLSLVATVPISTATIRDQESREQWLSIVGSLNVNELYVVPEMPNQPNEVSLFYGLIDLVFRLKRKDQKVLMGFTEPWAMLGFPYGLDGFASSGVKNRRAFQKQHFGRGKKSGGKGPEYYHFWTHQLLGSIRFPHDAEVLQKAGIWEELNAGSPYAPIFDGSSPSEIFRSNRWSMGRSLQNYSWMMSKIARQFQHYDHKERVEQVIVTINTAIDNWKLIAQYTRDVPNTHIQIESLQNWLIALNMYNKQNSEKIDDEFLG